MIIVFRYQLHIAIPSTFKKIAEANKLITEFNIIDSDNLIERVKKPITEIDKKLSNYIDKGLLIPDAFLIESLIQNWNSETQNIIVNFPKNIEQLNALKYYLGKLNDTIDKIIYYKINDFDNIYDIAKINYGKLYDSAMKESTVKSMRNHMTMTEAMIKNFTNTPLLELDFLNESISEL